MWHLRALGSSMRGMPACSHRAGAKGSKKHGCFRSSALGARSAASPEPWLPEARVRIPRPRASASLCLCVSESYTSARCAAAGRPAGARFRGDAPPLARTGPAGPTPSLRPEQQTQARRPRRGSRGLLGPRQDARPRPGRGVHAAPASHGRPHLFLFPPWLPSPFREGSRSAQQRLPRASDAAAAAAAPPPPPARPAPVT